MMLQSGAAIEYAQQYSPRTSVYEFLGECSSYATSANGSTGATSAAATSGSSSNSRSSRHYSGSAAGSSSSSTGVVPYVPGAACIGLTGGFAKLWVAHDKETGKHYMSKVCMQIFCVRALHVLR
jgi:hypothetical protein